MSQWLLKSSNAIVPLLCGKYMVHPAVLLIMLSGREKETTLEQIEQEESEWEVFGEIHVALRRNRWFDCSTCTWAQTYSIKETLFNP